MSPADTVLTVLISLHFLGLVTTIIVDPANIRGRCTLDARSA